MIKKLWKKIGKWGRRIVKISLALFLCLTLLVLCMLPIVLPALGGSVEGKRLQRVQQSPHYNHNKQTFENQEKAEKVIIRRPGFGQILYRIVIGDEEARPPKDQKLPQVDAFDIDALKTKSQDLRFAWFGHSTVLLEVDGLRILIDPMFSGCASPIPGIIKRFQDPAINIEKIPEIDLVIISHDHYDHLDHKTILKLKETTANFLVPLGVGTHLESWGIPSSRITELDWWQSAKVGKTNFVATPSRHFSGRTFSSRNKTLWASWCILGQNGKAYFSGDSGYGKHYKQIGDKYGPFDITFIENGAYNENWPHVHQLPEDGVKAHQELKGKVMLPIHWAMFNLSTHKWRDPFQRVVAAAKQNNVKLTIPMLGQIINPKSDPPTIKHWEKYLED